MTGVDVPPAAPAPLPPPLVDPDEPWPRPCDPPGAALLAVPLPAEESRLWLLPLWLLPLWLLPLLLLPPPDPGSAGLVATGTDGAGELVAAELVIGAVEVVAWAVAASATGTVAD